VATLGLGVTACLLLAQLALPIPLFAAVAIHVAWAVPNGARGPAANALLTEVLPARRGTVVSLNSGASALGTLLGASVGGLAVGLFGFPALGALCAAMALIAAGIVQRFVTEPSEG
jgi:predicted MFS family arabinose efflux permease